MQFDLSMQALKDTLLQQRVAKERALDRTAAARRQAASSGAHDEGTTAVLDDLRRKEEKEKSNLDSSLAAHEWKLVDERSKSQQSEINVMEELDAVGVDSGTVGLAHLKRQHEKDLTTLTKMLSKDHTKQKTKLADRAKNRRVVMLQALKLQGASEEEINQELTRLGGTETMVQDELAAQLGREKDRMLKEALTLQEAEKNTASRYLGLQDTMGGDGSGSKSRPFYSHPHLVLIPGLDSAVAAMNNTKLTSSGGGRSAETEPLGLGLQQYASWAQQGKQGGAGKEEEEFNR
jgi:hypothetical protein